MSKTCDPVDIVYYTFWPILAFSFFIATDEIVDNDIYKPENTNAIILAMIIVVQKIVHMFALLCLVVSLLETYLAFQLLRSPTCTRKIFLEVNAFTAAVFLVILSFLDCLSSAFDVDTPLSSTAIVLCKIIPFFMTFILLLVQLGTILFNSGIIKKENERYTIKIFPTNNNKI